MQKRVESIHFGQNASERWRAIGKLLAVVVSAMFLVGCSKRDPMFSVSENDPDINAAIAKARETLPQFWESFQNPKAGEEAFSLKVKITDIHGVEHFWVVDLERKGGKIFGTINNDPEIVHNVKLGERLEVPEGDISDWMYMRNGKIVGNLTLKAEFKKMSADEVAKYKAMFESP